MGTMAVIFVGFAALLMQSVNLQVRQGNRMIELGRKQRVRNTQISAERGDLVDRYGVPLAMSVRSFRLVADPKQVTDLSDTSLRLSRALGVDRLSLRERLARDSRYVVLARGIDEKMKTQVERLGLAAITFEDEPQRVYPAGDLARSVLGRVTRIDSAGLSGLEKLYDSKLIGTPGQRLVERKPGGRSIPSGTNRIIPAKRGTTYVLTLDRALQYAVEGMLAQQISTTGAKGGIVVVTDPRNGDVLSLASMAVDDEGYVVNTPHNAALVNVYEPGSVNKMITLSAALEKGVVGPQSTMVVPDLLQVGDHQFKDDEPHPPTVWTPRDILANSSNIGTIQIAKALGRKSLEKYLRAFGLGSKTEIGFPGESAGLLVDKDQWSPTSIGSVPIGQGIAVTALQMLQAYNTIANGGTKVPVRLVRATIDAVGRQHEQAVRSREKVVSERTARLMTGMLTEVVRSGTGKAAAVSGYDVAGKTGTAMKPLENARGYEKGAYVSSFIGFFPAERPRFSAIVVLDEPQSSIYGGVVAAPLFGEVARFASQHYRIPPTSGNEVSLTAPSLSDRGSSSQRNRELAAVERTAAVAAATPVPTLLPGLAVATPAPVGVPDLSRPAPAAATTATTTGAATTAAGSVPAAATAPAGVATTPAAAASSGSVIPDLSTHSSGGVSPRIRSTWTPPTTTVARRPATNRATRSGNVTVAAVDATRDARIVAAQPPATVVAG